MDMMAIRRRVLLGGKKVIDTSPKIAEYGKGCAYAATGERDTEEACITEWYQFEGVTKGQGITLYYYYFSTTATRPINYQYYGVADDGTPNRKDWYYNTESHSRKLSGWPNSTFAEIRFSVPIADIDAAYAYCAETGQIFFAGKNSPYYGSTNINDMPT